MTRPQVFSTGNDCMVIRKERERQIRVASFSPGSRPVHRPAIRRSKLQPFSVPKTWVARLPLLFAPKSERLEDVA